MPGCYVFYKLGLTSRRRGTSCAGILAKLHCLMIDSRSGMSSSMHGQSVGRPTGQHAQKCLVALGMPVGVSLAANTVTGTLTSVTSASVFTDTARLEPDDTFGAGTIQFLPG